MVFMLNGVYNKKSTGFCTFFVVLFANVIFFSYLCSQFFASLHSSLNTTAMSENKNDSIWTVILYIAIGACGLALLALAVLVIWFILWEPLLSRAFRPFVDDPRPPTIVLASPEGCPDLLNPDKTATFSVHYGDCVYGSIDLVGNIGETTTDRYAYFYISQNTWAGSMQRSCNHFFKSWNEQTVGHLWNKRPRPRITIVPSDSSADYSIDWTFTVHAAAVAFDHMRIHSFAEAVWAGADEEGQIMKGKVEITDNATGRIVATYDIPRLRGKGLTTRYSTNTFIKELSLLFDTFRKEFISYNEQLYTH